MQILRVGQVAKKIGVSVAWIWKQSKDDPGFPKTVKISPNITGWVESEIDDYLAQKISVHRSAPTKRASTQIAADASRKSRKEIEHVQA